MSRPPSKLRPRIIARIHAGQTAREVAEAIGCSRYAVYYYCQEADIHPARRSEPVPPSSHNPSAAYGKAAPWRR